MSKYEEEQGSISFTKTGYTTVMRSMREAYNKRQDFLFDFATALHKEIAKLKPAQRNESYVEDNVLSTYGTPSSHYLRLVEFKGKPSARNSWDHVTMDEVHHMFDEIFRDESFKKPRKSFFKPLSNRVKEFSVEIEDGNITFNSNNSSIGWTVCDNNHAVDDAHESPYAKMLFSILKTYKWKNKEGGEFYYTNEYMREDLSSATCISHRFGNEKTIEKMRSIPRYGY